MRNLNAEQSFKKTYTFLSEEDVRGKECAGQNIYLPSL